MNRTYTTYHVISTPWEKGLELKILGVGTTQSHGEDDAEAMVRDYVAQKLSVAPDSFNVSIVPATPFLAEVSIRADHWWLTVHDRSQPEDAPESLRTPVSYDLGPDTMEFRPAGFSHRLIEQGFMVESHQYWHHDTYGAWTQDPDVPDRYTATCRPCR